MDYLYLGALCALVVTAWISWDLRRTPTESFDHNQYDDQRIDTIRDELDRQEMRTRNVKAAP